MIIRSIWSKTTDNFKVYRLLLNQCDHDVILLDSITF